MLKKQGEFENIIIKPAHKLEASNQQTQLIQKKNKKAVVITNLREGGLAEQAGLQVGDIILDVNRKAVHSARDAVKLFKKGVNSIRVLRGQSTMLVFMETK